MRFSATLSAAVLTATATAQFGIVLPQSAAAVGGSTANAFPWAITSTVWPGLRIMSVYDSTHFTTAPIPITYPILINRIKWRANDVATTTSWTGGTYNQAQIALATAAVDHTAATTTWAANVGPDYTVVHSGPVVVQPGVGAGVGVPGPYVVDVALTAPFLYDPNAGDLVVDTDYLFPGNWTGGTFSGMDVHATNVLARRVYSSSLYPVANGVDSAAPVIEIGYVPANGLYASFGANATGGPSPLTVQFTDTSFSSAPGGITIWAWDFNGDSVIDSTAQSPPPYTYTTCGSYTVSLTVTDGQFAPSTLTRTNYIVTDQIAANFSKLLLAPLTVQYTDTSNMPATSWAWDLNGDSIIDATTPTAAFVYPNTNPVAVSLTVTRLCSPPSTITRTVVPLPDVTTLFAGGNSGAALWTVYCDANVTSTSGLTIRGFATNSTAVASTPFSLDVYVKAGSYVGSHATPADWRLVGNAAGTTGAPNTPSYATLAAPIYLPPGNFALAWRYNGAAPSYTNGNGSATPGSGTNQTYSSPDVTLLLGGAFATTVGPFAAPAGSALFAPRVWNGAIYYETNTFSGVAGYGFFGAGCPGSLGIPQVINTNQPTIGGTLNTNLSNLQVGIAVMVLGTNNSVGLPLDLGFLGAPGCLLRVSVDATATVVGAGTSAAWSFMVPNLPALMGFMLYNQAASLDSSNTLGLVMSDAYAWVIGV